MKSVPPRGSGWVLRLPIVNCRFSIGVGDEVNWQSEIKNQSPETHPLPRGSTELMGPRHVSSATSRATSALVQSEMAATGKRQSK